MFNTRNGLTGGVIAAVLLTIGTISARPAHAQTRFVSPGGKYSFAAPAKWDRDDADISMGRMRYVKTVETRVIVSLSVRTVTDTGTTLDSLADAVRQTAKDNGDKETTLRDKPVTGAAPGIVIETSNARSEEPNTEMTFITVHNGVGCQIVLACKTADAAKYRPYFEKAVSTFRWK